MTEQKDAEQCKSTESRNFERSFGLLPGLKQGWERLSGAGPADDGEFDEAALLVLSSLYYVTSAPTSLDNPPGFYLFFPLCCKMIVFVMSVDV